MSARVRGAILLTGNIDTDQIIQLVPHPSSSKLGITKN